MDKIAVLIPCYNEGQTIKKVVDDFKRELPDATIYVYDNNSTDNTISQAQQTCAIIRHESRQGKGNVIRTMFREIDAHCYLMIDGDDTYPAEHARELVSQIIDNKADMAIGDRLSSTYFTENKSFFNNLGNILVRKVINKVYKSDIKDVMTGYRAFGYKFVKTFPILSKGFEIETEMTIHALDKNLLIKNVLVKYRNRPSGSQSKISTFKDGYKVLKTIFNLYRNYKPLNFFMWTALFSMLIAIGFLIPVLIEYFQTGLVPKMPSFLTSVFFFLCSIQSFFEGLNLDTMIRNNRRDFEIKYNEWNYREKINE
ncbi:MAG: glycosyltransferase family 2 protein [Bacteroidales bacterium]|nr:glycosyltransferase family 2 protein [Bacteroidales bacterium]